DRKAVFEFELAEGKDLEELELELIDGGLEELEASESMVFAYADYTNFGAMSSALEEAGIEVSKANLQRISNSPQSFTDEQLEDIENFIDKLEDDDDVQAVYTNVE